MCRRGYWTVKICSNLKKDWNTTPEERMSCLFSSVLLLCMWPCVVPLFCYTCVFPAISPLDCIRYPTRCPPGQRCLSSKAIGQRGEFQVVLYEKSCVLPSFCGITGEKFAMGLNFTFTNDCCDTHLCNGALALPGSFYSGTLISLALSLLFSQ